MVGKESTLQMEDNLDDGFIIPTQRSGRQKDRPIATHVSPVQTRQNSFQVLMEEEVNGEVIPNSTSYG